MKFALPFLLSGLFIAVVVWTLVNAHPVQMPPVSLPKEKPIEKSGPELTGIDKNHNSTRIFFR
ncbi:MAG TPA: hypothetical protein VM511_12995 [Luteolibacter sp.]|nr:hypothetical protein [Luteolibacter sp.]